MSSTVQAAWPTRLLFPATIEPSFLPRPLVAGSLYNYNIGGDEENRPSRALRDLPDMATMPGSHCRRCLMIEPRIGTYAEFWPYYLREHRRPATRAWHYLGTSVALLCLIGAVIAGQFWLLPLVLVA